MRFRPFLALAIAAAAGSARAEFRKDIPYAEAGGQRLLLDVHMPDGLGPYPVAVLIHGGGWSHGDKKGSDIPGNPADISPWFATLGGADFVWFSINYRLLPKNAWPAGFEDVQTAIAWIKRHAGEFKGDPVRIVIFGHSAGGNLAGLAAENQTDATRVEAVVLFDASTDYVPTDYPPNKRRKPTIYPVLQNLCRPPPGMSQEALAAARYPWPMDQVTHFMPPVLILHGTLDQTVPFRRSVLFQHELDAAGVPCDFISIQGAPHSLVDGIKIDGSYQPRLIAWLRRTLAEPRDPADAPGAIVVAPGGGGDFKTVQAALDSLPRDNAQPRTILLKEGIYHERVRIEAPWVTLQGETRRSTRIEAGGAAPIVMIDAPHCALQNLSVQNTGCDTDRAAAAVAVRGGGCDISDCDLQSEGSRTVVADAPVRLTRLAIRGAADAVVANAGGTLADSVLYQTVCGGKMIQSAGLAVTSCKFDQAQPQR